MANAFSKSIEHGSNIFIVNKKYTRKKRHETLFLPIWGLVIFEHVLYLVLASLSLVQIVYLPAQLAPRRATNASMNIYLSSLKNVCEVTCFLIKLHI